MSEWTRLEDEAAQKISEVMRLMVRRRWDNATSEDRAKAVKLMAAGRKRKARRKK